MEEVFSGSKPKGQTVGFEQRPINKIKKRHDRQVVLSVLIIVFVLFLALGWVNFQSGKSFNIPNRITYKNALYQTEGEIVDGQELVKTGKKVDNLEIYIEEAEPGQTYSLLVHRVYVKAGEDYIVYVLKRKK